ncbi:MAG: hypothetical protein AAF652_17775 [Cyanobacteria bacterium P01_C01_bin.72]
MLFFASQPIFVCNNLRLVSSQHDISVSLSSGKANKLGVNREYYWLELNIGLIHLDQIIRD